MPGLKVCGITDPSFAVEAARRGVDYLGLIFADGSPRKVTERQAGDIVAAVAELSERPLFVGVFVGHDVREIAGLATRVGLDVIQLHGDYGPRDVSFLKNAGLEVWRLDSALYGGEDATLVDGRSGEKRGGTGHLADWGRVAELKTMGRRVVLAGGLSAGNIAVAAATGADILDVNSGIETAPGRKSLEKLDALLESLQRLRAVH